MQCKTRIATLALLVIVVSACATSTPAPSQSVKATRSRSSSANRYAMSAKTFFSQKAAQQTIDAFNLDPALLGAAIFHETNIRRSKAGKNRLGYDLRLEKAARMHAQSMANGRYLSHTNPHQKSLRTPKDRAQRAGYDPRYISENVATHFDIQYKNGTAFYRLPKGAKGRFSYQPKGKPIPSHTYRTFARSLLNQWMNSTGHRHNILSELPVQMGAGCAAAAADDEMNTLYCVQMFGMGLR